MRTRSSFFVMACPRSESASSVVCRVRIPGQSVQQVAQTQDLVALQRRIITNVEPIEVDMIGARVLPRLVRPEQPAQIRLPHLIAATRRAAPILNPVGLQ